MKKIFWTAGAILLTLRAISMGNDFDAKKESPAFVCYMGACVVLPIIGLIIVTLIVKLR